MQKEKWFSKEKAGVVIAIIMFCIYPLFMTNGYYNVTVSKEGLFGSVAIVSFFFLYGMAYMERVKKEKGFHVRKFGEIWNSMALADCWMTGFAIASFFAFIFAKYREVAFSGCTDSYQGFFFVILLAMMYFVVRKLGAVTEKIIFIMAAGMDITVLLALWQFMGGDPFGLFVGLSEQTDHVGNYLSTLGNTAVFGLYITLLLPVCGYAYCKIESVIGHIVLAISSLIGIMGVLCSNTDATYLGFFCSVVFLGMILMGTRKTCLRYLELLGVYGVGGLLFQAIYQNCNNARALSTIVSKIVETSLVKWGVALLILLVCRGMLSFLIKKEKVYQVLKVLVRIVVIVVVVVVFILFFYFSLADRETNLGGLEKYLRFNEEWGTQRGYVWSWLASIFSKAGIVQKVFGAGQGSVVLELFTYYRTEMIEGLGYFFDNAHNVYLHYLTTMGINGCMMYLGLLFGTLWQGLHQSEEKNSYRKGVAVAVAAYAVQGFFSILEPITVPILIFFLGIIQNESRS